MAKVDMVANTQTGNDDLKGLPLSDSANVVNWTKTLKMWFTRKKRNHIGLEEKPPRPHNNASAHVREEYLNLLAIGLEHKDTCISAIYKSVLNVHDALI